MQKQYKQLKEEHPDGVMLFRLGDFYEAFNADAEKVSEVLGITLTGRGKDHNRVPMAGIPFHALDNYLPKLLKAGITVVVVDQLSQPQPGELVERGVKRIYTAGTITEDEMLAEHIPNYLAAVYTDTTTNKYALAFSDISTGPVQYFQTSELQIITTELERLSPAEVIVAHGCKDNLTNFVTEHFVTTTKEKKLFDPNGATQIVCTQLGVTTLAGYGITNGDTAIVSALGGLFGHVIETQQTALPQLQKISSYQNQNFMILDGNAVRNLELVQSIRGNANSSLLTVLDECSNSMGRRLLYQWLLRPLLVSNDLEERWQTVDILVADGLLNEKLREKLKSLSDMERIAGRIGNNSANPRDLNSLRESLGVCLGILHEIKTTHGSKHLTELKSYLEDSPWVESTIQLIVSSISPEAPIDVAMGGVIVSGFNQEIDKLRTLRQDNKITLTQIQTREAAQTGIPSLKVSYNRVFGYFIEVTHTHSHKVPEHYIRKQTLANAERYITPELKQLEEEVLSADERLRALEFELFLSIRDQIAAYIPQLLKLSSLISQIDVLSGFAFTARQYRYIKPELCPGEHLEIEAGRHPVVERHNLDFVPNNTSFDAQKRFMLLTGPNMAGKSTYIRQVALLVLMAQIGSFVPANQMRFSLVDRIFTRVGASDNLAGGESTFMVEMIETANILNNATPKSLVILDEVGRGTSTYDGVAIAWSVAEYLIEKCKCAALFATHYHELGQLCDKYSQIFAMQVAVTATNNEIVFKHQIVPGTASRSYGVHVAKMAGVPAEVITRANDILKQLQTNSSSPSGRDKHNQKSTATPQQLGLL